MMGKRYTAQEMIDAITEARGFVTAAADKLGCSRRTVYRYINNYATVAENKLMSAINDGNVTAIIFYLKTQCKTRGYVERYQQEITGADGGPVVIRWPEDKDGD
jgi:transcriptional antiterminator